MNLPQLPFSPDEWQKISLILSTQSPLQLAWLSGLLWAQAQQKSDSVEIEPTITPMNKASSMALNVTDSSVTPMAITVISASQTGNARQVAQQLTDQLHAKGWQVVHTPAAKFKANKLSECRYVVIVSSTQGDGEVPEEALALMSWLTKSKAPSLAQLHYAVLGLGDSSYPCFCQAGKQFDEQLAKLNANRLIARGDADVDFAGYCQHWIENLIATLMMQATPIHSDKQEIDVPTAPSDTHRYSKAHPFSATILTNQPITGRQSDRDIRHIEFDLAGSDLHYRPGDCVGIWYKNSEEIVDLWLTTLQLNDQEEIMVDGQCIRLREALIDHYDLTKNSPNFVTAYAQLTQQCELLAAIKDPEQLNQLSQTMAPIDIVLTYPSTSINANALLTLFKPLTPRFYSIASAQEEVGESVHLTVGLLQYQVDQHTRYGGASSYLAQQQIDDKVRLFITDNEHFRLPESNQTPIIMIAAGTGIAPFRAFMQYRDHQQANGENWLIFGNPHFSSDFLYQLEWQQYYQSGLLTHIDLAWSRDKETKFYVQDCLQQQAQRVWQWLEKGAVLYVCGATAMAKAVDKTLLMIIAEQGNRDDAQAQAYLLQLRLQHRYQKDVY